MNGKELKKIREQHNLTQKELADKLGTYPQKVSNWENGVYKTISRLYIEKIKEVFGIR